MTGGGGKPECPCVDGKPDPCTLCGEPADGVCAIDTLRGWEHRAREAEAALRDALAAAAPSPVWVPLAERWPEVDGGPVWQHDHKTGVTSLVPAGEILPPDSRDAPEDPARWSWVPASVPEPPEEGEVER